VAATLAYGRWIELWQAFVPPDTQPMGKQLAVGRNEDGSLHVFVLLTDNKIYHSRQVAAGMNWTPFARLGQAHDKGTSLAVGQNPDGRLEVFVIGTDDRIYRIWQTAPNGAWHSKFEPLGQPHDKAKQIAVGRTRNTNWADKKGHLEVFVIGTDDGIYQIRQTVPFDGGWESRFSRLGQPHDKAKQITVGQNRDRRLEVFVIGTDDRIWRSTWAGPGGRWSGWHLLTKETREIWIITIKVDDTKKCKQLVASPTTAGRPQVIVIGSDDNRIYYSIPEKQGIEWKPWKVIGGPDNVGKQLAVSPYEGFALDDIFLIGTDDAIYNINSSWNGWLRLGTTVGYGKQLAVEKNLDGRFEVFVIGTDNKVYHNWQTAVSPPSPTRTVQMTLIHDPSIPHPTYRKRTYMTISGKITKITNKNAVECTLIRTDAYYTASGKQWKFDPSQSTTSFNGDDVKGYWKCEDTSDIADVEFEVELQ
jgi:hypothetical protein